MKKLKRRRSLKRHRFAKPFATAMGAAVLSIGLFSGGGLSRAVAHAAVETAPKHEQALEVALGNSGPAADALNESLSLLGYLPLTFHPAHGVTTAQARTELAQDHVPVAGWYTWNQSETGRQLADLWHPQSSNVMTQGAVMRFEFDHGLGVDGIAGPEVWRTLEKSLATDAGTTEPYRFITVDEQQPETLRVWSNGSVILSSLCNTGVSESPTSIGTWPVYLRYASQEMSGITPWGTTYADPGVPYVNYFNQGEAVHGFPRNAYGFPQSLGCVELPIPVAAKVWTLINYGTLVSIRANERLG